MKKITSEKITYFANRLASGDYAFKHCQEELEYWYKNNYDLNIKYKKNNTIFFHMMQFNPWNYNNLRNEHHEKFLNLLNLISDKVDVNVRNRYKNSYSRDPVTTLEASLCWKDKEMSLFHWLTNHPKFDATLLENNDYYLIFKKLGSDGYQHYYDEVLKVLLPLMNEQNINSAIGALIHTQADYYSKVNFEIFKEMVDKLSVSPFFKPNQKDHHLTLDIMFSRKEDSVKDLFHKYIELISLNSSLETPNNETPTNNKKKLKV